MQKITLLSILTLSLVGCSGKRIKPDYVVKEAKVNSVPKWLHNPAKVDSGSIAKEYKYFIEYAESSDPRLCESSAEARAKSRLSREFSEFVKRTYEETVENKQSSVTNYLANTLAKEVHTLQTQNMLSGVEVANSYWERRQFLPELGATHSGEVYVCYVVVKMKKDQVEKVTELSLQKMLESIRNQEIRQSTAEALQEVSQDFVEAPAELPPMLP